MRNLNLNHLYYFYVVAKEGSIRKASQRLHVTQPTISYQLKLLEDCLGSQLFSRKNQRLIINPAGLKLLSKAEKIFSISDSILNELEQAPRVRKLELGYVSHLPMSRISKFCSEIKKADPDLQLSVLQDREDVLLEKLRAGEIHGCFFEREDARLQQEKLDAYLILEKIEYVFCINIKGVKTSLKNFHQKFAEIPYLAFGENENLHKIMEKFGKVSEFTVDSAALLVSLLEEFVAFSVVPQGFFPLLSHKELKMIKMSEQPTTYLCLELSKDFLTMFPKLESLLDALNTGAGK